MSWRNTADGMMKAGRGVGAAVSALAKAKTGAQAGLQNFGQTVVRPLVKAAVKGTGVPGVKEATGSLRQRIKNEGG